MDHFSQPSVIFVSLIGILIMWPTSDKFAGRQTKWQSDVAACLNMVNVSMTQRKLCHSDRFMWSWQSSQIIHIVCGIYELKIIWK